MEQGDTKDSHCGVLSIKWDMHKPSHRKYPRQESSKALKLHYYP